MNWRLHWWRGKLKTFYNNTDILPGLNPVAIIYLQSQTHRPWSSVFYNKLRFSFSTRVLKLDSQKKKKRRAGRVIVYTPLPKNNNICTGYLPAPGFVQRISWDWPGWLPALTTPPASNWLIVLSTGPGAAIGIVATGWLSPGKNNNEWLLAEEPNVSWGLFPPGEKTREARMLQQQGLKMKGEAGRLAGAIPRASGDCFSWERRSAGPVISTAVSDPSRLLGDMEKNYSKTHTRQTHNSRVRARERARERAVRPLYSSLKSLPTNRLGISFPVWQVSLMNKWN